MPPEDPENLARELDRLLAQRQKTASPPDPTTLSAQDAALLELAAALKAHPSRPPLELKASLRRRLEDRIASRTPQARLVWRSLVSLAVISGMLIAATLAAFSVRAAPAVAADNAAPAAVSLTTSAPHLERIQPGAPHGDPALPRPLPTPIAPRLPGASFTSLSSPAHTPLASADNPAP